LETRDTSFAMQIHLTEQNGEVRFAVKVVPGASRDRIVGALGDALKVSVKKPPEGGAANAAVVGLLAAALGVPAGRVQIVRGHATPRKEISVSGLSAPQVRQKLAAFDQSSS
jgi:uncharacterized protein (TIGR00251 family)